MSTRDNVTGKESVLHIAPAARTTTHTPADGSGVDTKGAEAVMFNIHVGDVPDVSASPQGDGSWTIKAQEADTDANSSYSDITESARIIPGSGVSAPNSSTGVFLTLDAPAKINRDYMVGVISTKRYVRLIVAAVSTPGSSVYSASAIKERLSVVV